MSWQAAFIVVGLVTVAGTIALGLLRRGLRLAAGLAVVSGGTLPWPRDAVTTFSQVVTGWVSHVSAAIGPVAPWAVAATALAAFVATVRGASRAALGWGLAVVPALSLIPGPAEHVGSGAMALGSQLLSLFASGGSK